jgi:hypothetical protein
MSRLARDLFLGGAIGEIRLLRDVKDFPRPLAGVEGLVGNVRPVYGGGSEVDRASDKS